MISPVSVAIIDTIGIPYDGTTLSKRGLGGSESAVILMSKELVKLGMSVTVFNNCVDDAKPGTYDGVRYVNQQIPGPEFLQTYSVVISSRSTFPFLPDDLFDEAADFSRFHGIVKNASWKAIWMHDTFCSGDQYLEFLVVNSFVDELFTLSDFHTNYVTTCTHGPKRMFEALKSHIFETRNGISLYKNYVNVAAKDPDLFVYNASVTKGMVPLVEKIWPKIKQAIPNAKLKIIGGYYRFRENAEPDEQEKKWRKMVSNPLYFDLGIEFTGIIRQDHIAEILSEASFMLYPAAFPETFGISTLESLAYNTPLITMRFGALEETAVAQASYMMDYPVEPNALYPHINAQKQEDRFVALTVEAHRNKYLHQQKMNYCGIVKDVCGWDTVALQWKQHLYKKLDRYLSVNEYRKVSAINARVREVFGRRFSNPEETYVPRNPQRKILVVTPMYQAARYIRTCIASVLSQDYDNWEMVVIDDASTDNGYELASGLALVSNKKISVVKNDTNLGAPFNQIMAVLGRADVNDIIMLLDGDDWLVNDNQIFQKYNNLYQNDETEFTYGSCWSLVDGIPLVAQEYPPEVKEARSYRKHKFAWNMPYTHLRTFKAGLLGGIDSDKFKDAEGNWYKAGGDGSIFYALIEKADPNKIKAVKDIVYVYNDASPLNDYKVNGEEQTKNATRILTQ